jgi:hypothetical protein
MALASSGPERDPALRNKAAVFFTVTIAAVGAMLMSVTSSPTAKGASFLWLPAALQLIAGVWLGPVRGAIVGGLGAYLAGILNYGGWGLRDIIMNLIAGGVTNAFLPSVLFSAWRIDPTLGAIDAVPKTGVAIDVKGWRLFMLFWLVMITAFVLGKFNLGLWGYAGPFFILVLAPALVLDISIGRRQDFVKAAIVVSLASACSALLGSWAQVLTVGQSWFAALSGTGLGWFLGNATSCILGLYVLAAYTKTAREYGLCK